MTFQNFSKIWWLQLLCFSKKQHFHFSVVKNPPPSSETITAIQYVKRIKAKTFKSLSTVYIMFNGKLNIIYTVDNDFYFKNQEASFGNNFLKHREVTPWCYTKNIFSNVYLSGCLSVCLSLSLSLYFRPHWAVTLYFSYCFY